MGFGKAIRDYRTAAGLTQDQLAEKLGCSSGYIPALENEKRLPSLEFCIALAEVAGLSAQDRQKLLEDVEAARRKRDNTRIRTRGAALKTLPPLREVEKNRKLTPVKEMTEEGIARAIAGDPDLRTAHEHLTRALSDPQMRSTVLAALEAFARAARTEKKKPDG
jgi:transcriptional regulator with XRE-family HTH domain